jgi:hypothetical protein
MFVGSGAFVANMRHYVRRINLPFETHAVEASNLQTVLTRITTLAAMSFNSFVYLKFSGRLSASEILSVLQIPKATGSLRLMVERCEAVRMPLSMIAVRSRNLALYAIAEPGKADCLRRARAPT